MNFQNIIIFLLRKVNIMRKTEIVVKFSCSIVILQSWLPPLTSFIYLLWASTLILFVLWLYILFNIDGMPVFIWLMQCRNACRSVIRSLSSFPCSMIGCSFHIFFQIIQFFNKSLATELFPWIRSRYSNVYISLSVVLTLTTTVL